MKKNNFFLSVLKVTAVSTIAVYGFNKFIDYCSLQNSTLHEDDGNFYMWKYGKIFYRKEGTGKPLLLIHDLSHTASGKEWDNVINDLSSTRTVYVIDLLGCGRSEKPAVTYTNYLYVQLLTDFVKDVIGEKSDVLVSGESSPLIISSCSNISLFDKIIMVNPSSVSNYDIIPNSNTRIVKKIIELPIVGTFAYNILNTKNKCFEQAINEYFLKDDYTSFTYSHTMYDSAHKGGSGSKFLMASLIGLYTNLSIRRFLISLNNDLYIIGGSNEANIEESISSYKAMKANITSTIINSSRHLPQLENPKEFTSAVNKFLDN